MPNIKPISDLRNYTEVLHDVAVGEPVFLTKNGRGRYALLDIRDYEKMQATIRLMNDLAKGRRRVDEPRGNAGAFSEQGGRRKGGKDR